MKKVLVLIFVSLFLSSAGFAQVLSLDDCIRIALDKNTNILNASSNLKIAKATKLGSYGGLLPNISFGASPRRTFRSPSTIEDEVILGIDPLTQSAIYGKGIRIRPSYTIISYGGSVSINQTLWDNGRMWNQVRQAEAGVKSSNYGFRNTVIYTVLTINERYFGLLKATEQYKVLEESVAAAEEQLKNSESRFEIGTVAQVDVLTSKVNLGNRKLQILNQNLNVENARNQLNQAMGREIGTPIVIDANILTDVNLDFSLDELNQRGLRANPLILQGEQNIHAANMGVNVAKSARYPRISYSTNYSRSNSDLSKLYTDFNRNYNLSMSLSLSMNIFDGFQTRSNIQRARNNARISEQNLLETKRTIHSNIRYTYLQIQTLKEQVDINTEIVAAAEEDVRMANELYRVGSGILIETINRQAALTNAQYILVSLKYDLKTAEARLKAAVGSLDDKFKSVLEDKN